jgi:hypothetical protein
VKARGTLAVRLALVSVAIATTACASTDASGSDGASGPDGAPATSSPSVEAPGTVWVAVLGSADRPDELGADRKRALAALGDVLEGYVVVSPTSCLEGLPDDVGDGYVLAIQRESRDDVQALASQLPEEPSFIGAVTQVCTD